MQPLRQRRQLLNHPLSLSILRQRGYSEPLCFLVIGDGGGARKLQSVSHSNAFDTSRAEQSRTYFDHQKECHWGNE